MWESDLATYIETKTGIPTVVGLRPSSMQNGINLFPSTSVCSNYYDTTLYQVQISVRNTEIDVLSDWVERVKTCLKGFYGTMSSTQCIVWIDSTGGIIFEEDGDTNHIPIFVNIKI